MGQDRALRREAWKSKARRCLSMRSVVLSAIVFLLSPHAQAQFSGYSSISFGYHQNPLYNYAKISDQLKLGYLELSYQNESDNHTLSIRYVGGLTAFNQLQDRTYYEHGLAGLYALHFTEALPDTNSGEEEPAEADSTDQTDKPPTFADSTGRYLTFGLRLAARHDRVIRQDFDNRGVDLTVAYRFTTGEYSFGRILNTLTSRSYPNATGLSNANNVLSAELAGWSEGGFVYGVSASAGIKYYTTSVFDTTVIKSTTGNAQGKGKGIGATTLDILLKPQINGTIQLSAGLFLRKDWSAQSSLSASACYRLTPRYAERYIVPLSAEASLTEDMYADFFTYEGPDVQIRLTQPLFANIQAILGYEFQYKKFGIPALNLEGLEIEPTRRDIRSRLELYLSRYFEFAGGIGLDLSLGLEFARNQSNDHYNDFSSSSISFGVGIGF